MAKKPAPVATAAPAAVTTAAPASAPPLPPTATPSQAPPPPIPQLPFKIEVGAAPPERARIGRPDGAPSPYVTFMKSMPAPTGDAYASFFIAADEAPATVTDPAERDKVNKENARKITNNIGAISRRIKKQDATYNFTTREVTENGKRGVRVWRVAPAPVEAAAAPATA